MLSNNCNSQIRIDYPLRRRNVHSYHDIFLQYFFLKEEEKTPREFLLPTVPAAPLPVPTAPTAAPTTPRTSTSTTTTATTAKPFELTPLSTEPTTPRIYVSTSNFRPTLPNFSEEELDQDQDEASEEARKSDPLSLIQQIPLVLAPRKPKQVHF